MSSIHEVVVSLSNVFVNTGDETRSDCAMDLAGIILGKSLEFFKTKLRRKFNRHYVVPYQESIYISCLDKRIKYDIYKETTTDEILNVITGWVMAQYNDLDFYVIHGSKPVRKGFTLKEFGITNNSNLQVQVRLRGGCVISESGFEPYSESINIEDTLLHKPQLQNHNYKLYKDVLNLDLETILHVLSTGLNLNDINLDKNYILGLLEDVYFLYEDSKHYDLKRSLVRFFKYRGFKTIDFLKIFLDHFSSIELQNNFYFNDILSFIKSDFFRKTFSLVSFIVVKDSLRKLNIDLTNSSIIEILMRVANCLILDEGKFDPIYAIVRTVRDVLKAIQRWYQTGDLNALYNEYYVDDVWFKKSSELIVNSAYLSNPEEHGIDIYQFLSDLDVNIEVGENNIKNFRGDARRKHVLQKMILDLKKVRADELTKNAAMKSRQSPFSMLVYGTSSVGKSTFIEILYGFYGNLFNLNTDPSFRYARNGIDQYWSNFRTSHWCILFDDAAYMRPDVATSGDPSVMEIIQTINNVPFIPAQAELQDKGRTPVRCKLVLATTNSENLNAVHYFSCPLAVQRRFPYVINLKPKEEFAREDSNGMLDPTKVPVTVDGEYPNLWHITVKKVEANINDHNQATLVPIAEFDDIYTFLKWFGVQAQQHDETQNKVGHSLDIIRNNKVCKNCFNLEGKCECLTLQNDLCEKPNYSLDIASFILACILLVPIIVFFTFKKKKFNFKQLFVLKMREVIWTFTYQTLKNKFSLPYWRQCAALAAMLGALTVIVKQLSKTKLETQGNVNEIIESSTPEFEKDEQQNVWYNKNVELVPSDLPLASKSVSDINNFKTIVARSTALIRLVNKSQNRVSDGQAFNVCGNLWITNYHNVSKVNYSDEIWLEIIKTSSTGINCNVNCRFDPSMYKQIRNTDLVIMELMCCPPGRDLLKFVPDKPIVGVHEGIYVCRDKKGNVYYKNVSNIKMHNSINFTNCNSTFGYVGVPKDEDTIKGESGSILIINTPQGPVLSALHQAGAPNICIAIGFTNDDFPKDIISEGELKLGVQGYERKLGDLHPKSVPRWIEEGSCNVYGTLIGFRPKPRSMVKPSFISDIAVKYGYELKQGAPVMSGWEPWHIAFKPMTNMPKNFVQCEVRACTDAFIRDLSHLKLKLGILTDYESVNGLPGVKYIDGINRNSSMGFPWCKTKKDFLISDTSDEYPDGVTFPKEIWDLTQEIIKNYLSGRTNKPIFVAHLKDEPRSFKKIQEKKTRVFAGAPVDWSLVVRKFLLTFIKAFQENREDFEAAPGLNCQSLEWHKLYEHMTKFGETNFIAGDYANFDKSMLALFIMEAFRLIEEIHRINGATEEHIKVIHGIALDTAYNYQNFNGDMIQFFGSNPSGHPLTVVINSIVNALYMRYVYAKLNPKGFYPENFKKDVILMTYGDDNFMNVRDGCTWFNHTSIQKCLHEVGIKYTMADKEAESIPYINIKDVSFLKRSFRYDEDMRCYLAPLEHDSLNKMLTVQVKSKTVSAEAQALASIQSAIREYFFYGRKEFENRRALLQIIIEESGLSNYMTDHIVDEDGNFIPCNVELPTWEQLKETFFHNSRHIN